MKTLDQSLTRMINRIAAKTLQKPAKYKNQKVIEDGVTFDSRKEYRRWKHLQLLENAGDISNLKRQVTYELAPAVKFEESSRKKPALRIVVDFEYIENDKKILEDVKSAATITPTFNVKRHILLANFGEHIRIYT